ncbi:uncharacterized protein [Diabrotica undecimpunctata]|uniref:uncharacterized protein n=1 Tax=Diabrotica undecimpunctata TaxID=50387 RepID=UPI003B63DF1A
MKKRQRNISSYKQRNRRKRRKKKEEEETSKEYKIMVLWYTTDTCRGVRCTPLYTAVVDECWDDEWHESPLHHIRRRYLSLHLGDDTQQTGGSGDSCHPEPSVDENWDNEWHESPLHHIRRRYLSLHLGDDTQQTGGSGDSCHPEPSVDENWDNEWHVSPLPYIKVGALFKNIIREQPPKMSKA